MDLVTPSLKFLSLIPETILTATALLLALAAAVKLNLNMRITGLIVILSITITGIMVFFTEPGVVGGDSFLNDAASPLFKYVFLIAAVCTAAMFLAVPKASPTKSIISLSCLILSLVGMMFLSMSSSLLSLFVSLELCTLPLIFIFFLNTDDSDRIKTSHKFLLITSFSSLLILFGLSFLFGLSGALNFLLMKLQIAIVHLTNRQIGVTILLSIAAILTGLLFRSGLIPFQNWQRRLHHKLPLPIVAFLATAFLIAIVLFFSKLFINGLFAFHGPEMNPNDWGRLIGFVAFVNLLFGSIQLYRQNDLVDLMYYSNITQIGFILTGLLAMNPTGLRGAGFYIIAFVLATLGAYGVIYVISNSSKSTSLDSSKGLQKSSLLAAILLSIFLFSLAGLPLLAGFVAKFSVIEGALQRAATDKTYHWMYLVSGGAAVAALVTIIKFFKIVFSFFSTGEFPSLPFKIPFAVNMVLIALAVVIIAFGIFPDPILSFANRLPEAFGFTFE